MGWYCHGGRWAERGGAPMRLDASQSSSLLEPPHVLRVRSLGRHDAAMPAARARRVTLPRPGSLSSTRDGSNWHLNAVARVGWVVAIRPLAAGPGVMRRSACVAEARPGFPANAATRRPALDRGAAAKTSCRPSSSKGSTATRRAPGAGWSRATTPRPRSFSRSRQRCRRSARQPDARAYVP